MQKSKNYQRTIFNAEVLQEARARFAQLAPISIEIGSNRVGFEHEVWQFDTTEEFFAAYRQHSRHAELWTHATDSNSHFCFDTSGDTTSVQVKMSRQADIESVFEDFESNAEWFQTPAPPAPPKPKPTVFIGHGHSDAWRDLKDQLREQHHFPVEAYETGARAGHTIRDVLEQMMTKSSFAVLVLTAEDETSDGAMRARQNVVHEVGLFQGKLGFSRAIAIVQDNVEVFSNLEGVHQLKFQATIRETFGDVVATLTREFG